MTNLDKVIATVAKKKGLHKCQVEAVFRSQSAFVANTMKESKEKGTDKQVRLEFFGTFIVKPNKRELIERNIERAKQRKLEKDEEI